MKNMINIGCLVLLFALTACPSKENEKVEPKTNDLIGKWEWILSSCDCPQCKCIFYSNPQTVKRTHHIEIKNDSINYFSKDTLLFSLKYSTKNRDSISIFFESFTQQFTKEKYNYLLLDGLVSYYGDTIKIKKDIEFIKFKRTSK